MGMNESIKYNRTRYDERDTIFSRVGELKEGTDKYKAYYLDNPEKEEIDLNLRNHKPGRFATNVIEQTRMESTFAFLKNIRPLSQGSRAEEKILLKPEDALVQLKKIASDFGCVLSGACLMEDSFFYSTRGRGEHYGESVDAAARKYGFIFAVEMNGENISKAPGPAEMVEVTTAYAKVALAGMMISYWLRRLGYDALCHMDGETEIVLPPAAEKAGLGEIGRMGLLVTKEYGARVRLGAVTTNLTLAVDSPAPFGLKEFCIKCKKCARFCPSHAIDDGDNWGRVNHEKCFDMWNQLATDCGVCLASCPFSLKGITKKTAAHSQSVDQMQTVPLNLKQFMYENAHEGSGGEGVKKE